MQNSRPLTKKPTQSAKNPYEQDATKRQSLLDNFFGSQPGAREAYEQMLSEKQGIEQPKPAQKQGVVFESKIHSEQHDIPRHIEQLSQEIHQQLNVLKKRSSEFESEVIEIEKHTIQSMPEKPGIYHIRFMELLLSFLQNITAKVSEAKTWLSAMQSKKAKRGSAFMTRSKKKGTQYSMSQELATSRAVQ